MCPTVYLFAFTPFASQASESRDAHEAALKARYGHTVFYQVAPGYWQKSLSEALCKVQNDEKMTRYKIGLVRWCSGQTENEAMANEMSPDFEEFVSFLGQKVSLQDFKGSRVL